MKPYIENIWSPISGNSNEDLNENWITGVLKAYEMVHTTHSIDRRCGKSHARMNWH